MADAECKASAFLYLEAISRYIGRCLFSPAHSQKMNLSYLDGRRKSPSVQFSSYTDYVKEHEPYNYVKPVTIDGLFALKTRTEGQKTDS